jgi:hypothetical protein
VAEIRPNQDIYSGTFIVDVTSATVFQGPTVFLTVSLEADRLTVEIRVSRQLTRYTLANFPFFFFLFFVFSFLSLITAGADLVTPESRPG